ncbi:Histidine ammonia-lyase [Gaiella occulta]|uniref:Histidine ammonia-lyase n=1 Tax=Gaiella occulta TaxID=1002870 RepID=A0A7M2Z2L2_9ACTN|nr:aromatic amino acid ammonia-lyase [Gaiella occulta]RDI76224.1 Histidine ammonia-lyase [Gaiella occulta]
MIGLGREGLSRSEYTRIVRAREAFAIDPDALATVAERRKRMLAHVGTGIPAYGITTGLGGLSARPVTALEQDDLQRSLLTARAAGFGPPLPAEVVRGALLLRLAGFLQGAAGVSDVLCSQIAMLLERGWSPVVPEGPYGAAGEIGPLAHLFQTLVGEGLVRIDGAVLPAADALERIGIAPYRPSAKEGLALINGSPFATALGIDLADRFRVLVDTANVAAALGIATIAGGARALSPRVGTISGDPGAVAVQQVLTAMLAGEDVWGDVAQPPVSFRVAPQVHAAAYAALGTLDAVLDRRLRGTTDSPLFLDADDSGPAGLYPSGAFHAIDVVLGLEAVANAACHVANLVEKRLQRLLDARFSGLPDQLTDRPGVQAGVVALHKTVVGLTADARALATPVSVHAMDTSTGQEDVQAFTFLAAARLARLLEDLESALACELVALRQAASLAGRPASGRLGSIVATLASVVEPVDRDRTLSGDIERVRELIASGSIRAGRES